MFLSTRKLVAYILLLANVDQTCAKTPLYVGAMFPMTSSYKQEWTGGNGIQPAAQMAFDHVNAADVLTDYELKMIWNDTRVKDGLYFKFLLLNPSRPVVNQRYFFFLIEFNSSFAFRIFQVGKMCLYQNIKMWGENT